MDKIKDTVAYLNPIQTPVIAVDQPIYTLAKQIQWHWPEKYGGEPSCIVHIVVGKKEWYQLAQRLTV
jgi:hypothetical protein